MFPFPRIASWGPAMSKAEHKTMNSTPVSAKVSSSLALEPLTVVKIDWCWWMLDCTSCRFGWVIWMWCKWFCPITSLQNIWKPIYHWVQWAWRWHLCAFWDWIWSTPGVQSASDTGCPLYKVFAVVRVCYQSGVCMIVCCIYHQLLFPVVILGFFSFINLCINI